MDIADHSKPAPQEKQASPFAPTHPPKTWAVRNGFDKLFLEPFSRYKHILPGKTNWDDTSWMAFPSAQTANKLLCIFEKNEVRKITKNPVSYHRNTTAHLVFNVPDLKNAPLNIKEMHVYVALMHDIIEDYPESLNKLLDLPTPKSVEDVKIMATKLVDLTWKGNIDLRDEVITNLTSITDDPKLTGHERLKAQPHAANSDKTGFLPYVRWADKTHSYFADWLYAEREDVLKNLKKEAYLTSFRLRDKAIQKLNIESEYKDTISQLLCNVEFIATPPVTRLFYKMRHQTPDKLFIHRKKRQNQKPKKYNKNNEISKAPLRNRFAAAFSSIFL